MASFTHKYVVQVRDFGQDSDGRLYMEMDLIQGSTLKEFLRRESQDRER